MDLEKAFYEYACRILARRRYTAQEIRKKFEQRLKFKPRSGLKKSVMPPKTSEQITLENQAIEAVINRLKKLKFIDDVEYVELFIQSELRRKPQSRKLLERSLRQRGIQEDVMNDSLNSTEINEMELAKQAVKKKLRSLKNEEPSKQREKLYRFLASRGFNSNTIFQVIDEIVHIPSLQ